MRHDGGVLLPGTPDALTVHCFTDGDERDELADDRRPSAMGRAMARTLRAARVWLSRSPRELEPITRRFRNAAVFVRFWHVVEQNLRVPFFEVST